VQTVVADGKTVGIVTIIKVYILFPGGGNFSGYLKRYCEKPMPAKEVLLLGNAIWNIRNNRYFLDPF
jgi:hypothetical protein